MATHLAAFEQFLTDLEDAIRGVAATASPADLIAKLTPPLRDLFALVEEIGAAVPEPGDAFLSDAPGSGQMTLDDFCTNLADAILGADESGVLPAVLPGADPALLATRLAKALRALAPVIEPEVLARYLGNLERATTAQTAAASIGLAVASLIGTDDKADRLQWPADAPEEDAQKESEEKGTGMIPSPVLNACQYLLGLLPGSKSSTELGKRVHRWVMARYQLEPSVAGGVSHSDHLVVYDGRLRIDEERVRLVDAFDGTKGNVSGDQPNRLYHFNETMRNGTRRIRPDIADLHPTATGRDPAQDHGWFEIKPFPRLVAGYDELENFYMIRWNTPRDVPYWTESFRALPGTWFPPLLYIDPGTKKACVLLNFLGVIPYAVFDTEAAADATAAVAISTLAAMFARRLRRDVRRALQDAEQAEVAIGLWLAAVALLVGVTFVVVMAAAEALAAVELTAAVSALLAGFMRMFSQLQSAIESGH